MTDPVTGAEETALSESHGAETPHATALPPGSGGGGALAAGKRWRNYQIGAAVEGQPGTFHATEALSMEEVLVTSRPIDGDGAIRRATWELLRELPGGSLVPLREAHEERGWRFEVSALARGTPLREWIACHQVGLAEIERIVSQLSHALESLHNHGLVHLRVRPENVFVREEDRQLAVELGGFSAATLHTQDGMIPIEVDGYYAPPEAAGLFRHQTGPALCAWDWWSLGRVVQEAVHGQHVFGLLFERDVRGNPRELQPRVEAALLDRDPSGVRAGAVELLPENTSPRVRTLLRGLLASARDGRWGAEQVQHWMQGATVPDRYELPRDARLFLWRRRSFTLTEAAEFFSQPDYAIEGQSQLFPLGDDPASLRRFLEELPQFRAEHERVQRVLALVDAAPWQQLPLASRRAAVAGLALLALAPGPSRPALCVQRWKIDAAGLQEMLADAPPGEAIHLAHVLVAAPYRRVVEALDATAARSLTVLADAGFGAVSTAVGAGWVAPDDALNQVRLLRYALDAEKDLLARRDRLRAAYATNTDARLAAFLSADKPDRGALILLAFTGERPRDFGYVSHAEWDQQRAQELQQRAAVLRRAILWRRLHTIVAGSPAVLGPWSVAAALWLVPVALCVAAGEWIAGLGIAALGGAMRLAAQARINALLRAFAPDARPWTWRDRAQRCRDEAAAALVGMAAAPASLGALREEFNAARAALRALKLKPPPAMPETLPRLWEFWAGAVAGAVVPLSVFVGLFLFAAHVPKPPALAERPARPKLSETEASASAATGPTVGLFEEINDGFGRRLRGPLKAWDVPLSLAPRPAIVRRMAPASPEQRALAVVGAELLLEPYPRDGLHVMVAVPVPAGSEWGVVLYDSLQRELADGRTFFVADPLQERSWYWVGNRRVVYLGRPELLVPQFSLAPP